MRVLRRNLPLSRFFTTNFGSLQHPCPRTSSAASVSTSALRYSAIATAELHWSWPDLGEIGRHDAAHHVPGTFVARNRDGHSAALERAARHVILPTYNELRRHGLLDSSHFGKWEPLLLDAKRLEFESDLFSPSEEGFRLVDLPENDMDIRLWAVLLNFRSRRYGHAGCWAIWRAMETRRSLRQVDGPVAALFWRTILDAAVHNDEFLRNVCTYAEWLLRASDVRVPNLYHSVITSLILNRQYQRAFVFHLQLAPRFGPGIEKFTALLQEFLTDPEPRLHGLLQAMYVTTHHRQLYDSIVPFVFAQGHSILSRKWRNLLVKFNDLPKSPVLSRAPLTFWAGYFPDQATLVHEELRVAGLTKGTANPQAFEKSGSEKAPGGVRLSPEDMLDPAKLGGNIDHLLSRIRGTTFGVVPSAPNDTFFARWFATSWVTMATAMEVVQALGIRTIGPLSLQAIALREKDAKGVALRLEQLRQHDIEIGYSNYSRAVKIFAQRNEDGSLRDLLLSDLNPNVFNEPSIDAIMKDLATQGRWKQYRIIVRVKMALASDSTALSANAIMQTCMERGNYDLVLRVLDDVSGYGGTLVPLVGKTLYSLGCTDIDSHDKDGEPKKALTFYVAIGQRLLAMGYSLGVRYWQRLIHALARQGRFVELDSVCSAILTYYKKFYLSGQAAFPLYQADSPQAVRNGRWKCYHDVPRDLPVSHPLHPLAQLFSHRLQTSLIRWSFLDSMVKREKKGGLYASLSDRGAPSKFHAARGIRLLRLVKEAGVNVPTNTIRKAVVIRLRQIYGPLALGDMKKSWRSSRLENILSLAEMKKLCDVAWGGEVLPPLEQLQRMIQKTREGASYARRSE